MNNDYINDNGIEVYNIVLDTYGAWLYGYNPIDKVFLKKLDENSQWEIDNSPDLQAYKEYLMIVNAVGEF